MIDTLARWALGAAVTTSREPSLDRIQREEARRLLDRATLGRVIGSLVPITLTSWIIATDPSRWRFVALGVALLVGTILGTAERVWVRRGAPAERVMVRTFIGGTTAQLVMIVATGGLESPFVVTCAPFVLLVSGFAPPALANAVVVVHLVLAWTLYALHAFAPGLPIVPSLFEHAASAHGAATRALAMALMLSMIVLWMRIVGGRIRRSYQDLLARSSRSTAVALADHEEHARMLTQLGAEIAHELKNPLASVKSLTALVSRSLEGKDAERMAVVRAEIDRMEGILRGFLDYSRPLSPLATSRVAVDAIAHDVVSLFELLGTTRGIRLECRPEGTVEATCDPRKIKQVLVNLVQNALQACAENDSVTVRCRAVEDDVVLEVVDTGHGLDAEMAARAFEPGVSSRPEGSGLGLAISQAIARQHGGEVTLANGSGRGCVATLRWPREQREPTPSAEVAA